MYQFDRVGEVELENITEENQLELIDLGAVDFDENTVIVETSFLNDFVKKVEELNFKVVRSESVYRSKNPTLLQNEEQVEKIMDFIDELESNDDVLGVFCGFDYN
jgi:transcriptional/translational regulatory protein YebC/TACO1